MSTIHVVTAVNNEFAEHLAVMLYSLLENKVSKNPIIFYIINSQISEKNKSLLTKTVKRFNAEIKYLTIDPTLYDGFILTHHLTQETYHRISIPDLIEKDIEKVIYLDSDIVIKEDITKLWDINIDHYFLSAVQDAWLGLKKLRHSDLSIPEDGDYFNAGVLVLNLKKWREHNITNQIIDFMKNNQNIIRYPSQDSMNGILHDKWLQLDAKWNYQSKHLYNTDLRLEPAIIHYTGTDSKPWWSSKHPLRGEYMKYLKKVKK
ncbi:glycosyltransferase family 8 protein [Peribacillus sp. V2I11]|uniref:glycosyltransferase family 8 protein n=1 Tax=Peribacillus sp. V2I11 TaxID=3042277 RepID=UPI00277D5C95|nr:glycosyltransferase family 8 protein [Peribacillus sp. V2I11]MDQ0884709.1 lipopolysaccharide biosynthesis glycosyltransferase [Peribacillus sp. V2I11]